jgi:tetratricopeptide (TPR) repeat protein
MTHLHRSVPSVPSLLLAVLLLAAPSISQEAPPEAAAPPPPAVAEALQKAEAGDLPGAYATLRPWAREHPEDAKARRLAATLALTLDRAAEAEELLSDLPQDDPQVRLLWGRLLLAKDDARGALAMLQPLAAGGAELDREPRLLLAEAKLRTGQAAEAAKLLEGQTEKDPAAAILLARARREAGEPARALEALQPFLESMPEPVEDRPRPVAAAMAQEHGRALLAASRAAEAVAALERAVRFDASNPELFATAAEALRAAGRTEEAERAAARARRLQAAGPPEDGDPTARALGRAARFATAGYLQSAFEVLGQERALAPRDPRPRMAAVLMLLSLRQAEEALPIAEETLSIAPGSADAHYQRGAVHLALGRVGDAEKDLRKALELQPEHVPAMSDLAVLLTSKGEKAEARALLEKVLALRPDDPNAKASLERLK